MYVGIEILSKYKINFDNKIIHTYIHPKWIHLCTTLFSSELLNFYDKLKGLCVKRTAFKPKSQFTVHLEVQ